MKPFDLGWGHDVKWSMPWVDKNSEKGLEEKGVHWRKIIWAFHIGQIGP